MVRRLPVAIVLVASLAAPSRGAPRARVAVKVTQAGNGAASAGVALVDASTTEVAGADGLRAPWRARLRVATPATYHLLASVARLGAVVEGVSPLFATGARGTTRVILPVAAPSAAARTPPDVPRPTAAGAPVATVNEIVITGPGGTTSIAAPFLSYVFDRTQRRCGLRWVDRSKLFLEVRAEELQLQQEGRLDPSTPLRDDPLAPTVRVDGQFTDDGEFVEGDILLVETATGRVVVTKHFRGRREKFYRLFVRWSEEFADATCDALAGTTSTTTTTGTLASTTSTTLAAGCTSDADCGPCGCCSFEAHVCTGTANAVLCCLGPIPANACGPKTPASCPGEASCPPPAMAGGNYYHCAYCRDSGAIIEWYAPSGTLGMPGCTRR